MVTSRLNRWATTVTIRDVTGFENTDSHVRRWYLEKAIIPCLDKLFKGETND